MDPFHRRTVRRLVAGLAGALGLAILAGTAWIVWNMDAGSASQGGRIYLSVIGLLALGAVVRVALGILGRGTGEGRSAARTALRETLVFLGIMAAAVAILYLVARLAG